MRSKFSETTVMVMKDNVNWKRQISHHTRGHQHLKVTRRGRRSVVSLGSLAIVGTVVSHRKRPVGRVTINYSVISWFYIMPCACPLGGRVKCIGENKPIGVIYQKAWTPTRTEIEIFFFLKILFNLLLFLLLFTFHYFF